MTNGIINGIKWTAIERFSNQFIQFVVSIIIARLISPGEYGILGVLLVFINISQVFIDSGLGSSLIFHNKLYPKYLNTTFVFNLIVSFSLYLIIFFSSPIIESYYKLPDLGLYLRISALVLFSNSIIVVPTSILKIKLDFKTLSLSNLLSNIISAIIGISMAFLNFGIWALVSQLICKSVILAIIIIYECKWIPSLSFDKKSFKKLYAYGVNIFTTSILTKFTDEGISAVIAKYLTPFSLGIFTRSSQFATFPTSCIGSLINTVLFPSLSSIKNNEESYKKLYDKSIEAQVIFSIPIFLILAILAKPLILVLLSYKWEECIYVFQILCIGRILSLVANTTEQSLVASGYSGIFLKQQIVKLITKIIFVACALPWGIVAVAYADAFQTLLAFLITNLFAKSALHLNISKQLRIILKYLCIACISVTPDLIFLGLINNMLILLIMGVITPALIYVTLINCIFNKGYFSNIYLLLTNKIK